MEWWHGRNNKNVTHAVSVYPIIATLDGGGGAWPRSLKSTHMAHMCGGPMKVGRTKKLVD